MPSDDDIAVVDRSRLKWNPKNPADLLGEGSFGRVYRGLFNGAPVAIKVVKRPPRDENSTDDLSLQEQAAMKQHRREIHRFQVVQSPNIIQYLGVFRGRSNPDDLYIVTEFLEGGSLHDALTKMRARSAVLETSSFLRAAYQIACGLNHVHVESYTHGDMKPQNILLTDAVDFKTTPDGVSAILPKSAKVKIADFGLSKRLEGAESPGLFGSTTATTDFGTGPCGTYLYMSPEAYDGVGQLTDDEAKAADVYAFALVLFELLAGIQSWQIEKVRNPLHLSNLVKARKRPSWGKRKDHIDPAYVALVEECWSHDPKDRPTAGEIVERLCVHKEVYSKRPQKVQQTPPRLYIEAEGVSDISQFTDSQIAAPEPLPQNRIVQNEQQRPPPPLLQLPPMLPAVKMFMNGDMQRPPQQTTPPTANNPYQASTSTSNPEATMQTSTATSPPSSSRPSSLPSSRPTSAQPPRLVLPPRPMLHLPIGEDAVNDNARPHEGGGGGGRGGDDLFTTEEYGSPTLKHVQSWKLTESEADGRLADIQRRHGMTQANGDDEESDRETGCSTGTECDSTGFDMGLDMAPIIDNGAACGREDDDRHEIDRTYLGNLKLHKVNSQRIPKPDVAPLVLGDAAGKVGVMGTGSVAGEPETTQPDNPLSNTALLNSFFRVAEGHAEGGDGGAKPAHSPSPVTPPTPGQPANPSPNPVAVALAQHVAVPPVMAPQAPPQLPMLAHFNAPPVPQQPHPVQSGGGAMDGQLASPNTPDGLPGTTSGSNKRPHKYNSPSIDLDAQTESELSQKDKLLLTAGHLPGVSAIPTAQTNALTQPQPQQQPQQQQQQAAFAQRPPGVGRMTSMMMPHRVCSAEVGTGHLPAFSGGMNAAGGLAGGGMESFTRYGASAPPMSATCSSMFGTSTSSGVRYGMGRMSTAAGMSGYLRVDENTVMAAVHSHSSDAVGMLREWWWRGYYRAVAGGLQRARCGGEEYLEMVIGFIGQQNGLDIERRDVVTMNSLCAAVGHIARAEGVGTSAVTRAIPVVVGVLAAFQKFIERHPEVYASACFALCNLFKVYNVIADTGLRSNVASWLVYAIWRNVGDEYYRIGNEALGYTAMSAARNFMWMNEDNTRAFAGVKRGRRYGGAGYGGLGTLLECLKVFEWAGCEMVVEASLSALAVMVRCESGAFVDRGGVREIVEVGKRHCTNQDVCAVILGVLGVVFSGNSSTHGDTPTRAIMLDRADAEGVIQLVECTQNASEVGVLEAAYVNVLLMCRYSAATRQTLVQAGVSSVVARGVTALGRARADRAAVIRAGKAVVKVVREVCREDEGLRYLKESGVVDGLRQMTDVGGDAVAGDVFQLLAR